MDGRWVGTEALRGVCVGCTPLDRGLHTGSGRKEAWRISYSQIPTPPLKSDKKIVVFLEISPTIALYQKLLKSAGG